MTQTIVILGHGPVGKATAHRLVRAGHRVRVAQRTRPLDLTSGAAFQACDVLNAEAVGAAIAGADQVVLAVGFSYTGAVWRRDWPRAMANTLAACEMSAARLVFVDNLYMYGPQTAPLREDMPLADFGAKPAVRAAITRQWLAARDRVKVAALRAPDFYGPGVRQSHLGDVGFAAIAQGKAATLIAPPDTQHAFAYVPDFARAVETLLAAPDADFGQAWHVPSAPTATPRAILALGAAALGRKLKINAVPLGLLPTLAVFSPFLRELKEMRFQWDRPYHVDASKFGRRFWADATPFDVGAAQTARSFAAPVR